METVANEMHRTRSRKTRGARFRGVVETRNTESLSAGTRYAKELAEQRENVETVGPGECIEPGRVI